MSKFIKKNRKYDKITKKRTLNRLMSEINMYNKLPPIKNNENNEIEEAPV